MIKLLLYKSSNLLQVADVSKNSFHDTHQQNCFSQHTLTGWCSVRLIVVHGYGQQVVEEPLNNEMSNNYHIWK